MEMQDLEVDWKIRLVVERDSDVKDVVLILGEPVTTLKTGGEILLVFETRECFETFSDASSSAKDWLPKLTGINPDISFKLSVHFRIFHKEDFTHTEFDAELVSAVSTWRGSIDVTSMTL